MLPIKMMLNGNGLYVECRSYQKRSNNSNNGIVDQWAHPNSQIDFKTKHLVIRSCLKFR
jgi:hypothetical protein